MEELKGKINELNEQKKELEYELELQKTIEYYSDLKKKATYFKNYTSRKILGKFFIDSGLFYDGKVSFERINYFIKKNDSSYKDETNEMKSFIGIFEKKEIDLETAVNLEKIMKKYGFELYIPVDDDLEPLNKELVIKLEWSSGSDLDRGYSESRTVKIKKPKKRRE